jgi:hypothetical protein
MPNRSIQPPAPSETPPPEAAHPSVAVRWMALLVLGAGFAAFMASRDAQNRSQIEQAVERTAVGDRLFFPQEQGPAPVFETLPLVRAQAPEPKSEASMIATGTLDGSPHKLYIPRERLDATGNSLNSSWWLKTGPGLFLKVTRE